jgi:DNA repair exonuclease SbcCD ATPase subunit
VQGEIASLRSEVQGEIASLRSEVQGEIASLRSEVQGEIASLRSEVQGEIASLRSEVQGEIASLRSDVRSLEVEVGRVGDRVLGVLEARINDALVSQTRWVVGSVLATFVAFAGLVLGIAR